MYMRRLLLSLTVLIALSPGSIAHADESLVLPLTRDFSNYQPTIRPTRIDTSEAPAIDGNLSDEIWRKATPIDEFYQLEPSEGAPASERTVVRVLYDENAIYFSIHAQDRDPAAINASVKERDGDIAKDDLIRIYLDPCMSRRDGYAFEVNALGARLDALVQNNSDFLVEWNTLWQARSRIVSDGWTVEVAIPFRSISYDAARNDWGFDFFRLIRRKGERIRWSQISNQMPSSDISRSGSLLGVSGTRQGVGLDLQFYGTAAYKREWNEPREDDLTFQPSGNAYYRLTPSLTGTLTFNTDFSDTPLDERRVNTTRFGLFYPETRAFFLQDASVFEFGGDNLNGSVNGRPFFSRNIGLVNETPVDIVAGGKISGQVGQLGVGGLLVSTGGTSTTDGQVLSAARVTHPILDESRIGLVFTNGDPTGETENTVAGADFQFRNSTWFDGDTLKADFYYERSFSDVYGDDDSFGATIDFPNEPFAVGFQFKEVGMSFSPALGFVNRPGIRSYDGHVALHQTLDESSSLRWVEGSSWFSFVTDLNDRLESREAGGSIGVMTQDMETMFFTAMNQFENVPWAFELPGNVIVPAGQYEWNNATVHLESSVARPLSVVGEVECCSYFGGDLTRTFLAVNWRPDTTFNIALSHQYYDIAMSTGSVVIQIYGLNLGVTFTPDMMVQTQLEFDNVSDALSLSARYRWEFQPGSELFVGIGEGGQLLDESRYKSDTTRASIRIGHLMRF